MVKQENAVIIRSKTRLEQLKERFNTKAQAKFYIKKQKEAFFGESEVEEEAPNFNISSSNTKKRAKSKSSKQKTAINSTDFSVYDSEDDEYNRVLEKVKKELVNDYRIKEIYQENLPYNIFTEKDLVVVVGQDGLVANTAKYVGNLPILAINPLPEVFDGVLLPFDEFSFTQALQSLEEQRHDVEYITMAEVVLNDGQKLLAFNDFFVGISSHSSARYRLIFDGQQENQSSSGIIVSTGAGSTGWLSSLFNMASGIIRYIDGSTMLKRPEIDRTAEKLYFIVREPFISKHSHANIVMGEILPNKELIIESMMAENGMIFSDGIQSDFLSFNSGSMATFRIAQQKALLIKP